MQKTIRTPERDERSIHATTWDSLPNLILGNADSSAGTYRRTAHTETARKKKWPAEVHVRNPLDQGGPDDFISSPKRVHGVEGMNRLRWTESCRGSWHEQRNLTTQTTEEIGDRDALIGAGGTFRRVHTQLREWMI